MSDTSSHALARTYTRPHPALHFTPMRGWMNDPNGLLTWRGRYHLFYQHNPEALEPRQIRWGHAMSEDLLCWDHLPTALAPDPDGPDRDGCFSGDAVLHDGVPAIVYTGNGIDGEGRQQLPCVAFATDPEELRSWEKFPGNPVISAPPPGFGRDGFRDHCVWRENGLYYQAIASGSDEGRGAILLYRSRDLLSWEYVHPLFLAPDASFGHMWECPDFFRLDDAWVLVVSIIGGEWNRKVAYFVGDYANLTFRAQTHGRADWGSRLYAPQTFLDREGRRVLLGWLRERASEVPGADWCGWMSLPRELTLDAGRRLHSEPISGLRDRRRQSHRLDGSSNGALAPGVNAPLEICVRGLPTSGSTALRILYRDAHAPSVIVRAQPDQSGVEIEIDGESTSVGPGERRSRVGVSSPELRVFLDQASIEAYFGGAAAAELLPVSDARIESITVTSGVVGSPPPHAEVWELGLPAS